MRQVTTASATLLGMFLVLPTIAAGLPVVPAANSGVDGRVFPEAHQTSDYVSFAEALAGIDALAQKYPDWITVVNLGESYGWDNAQTGQHDRFPVLSVEVTNGEAPMPREQRQVLIFQLSIHGNEKGAREGGLRIIEDFASGQYFSPETRGLLDERIAVFTFANPDGWIHEEPQYRSNCANYFGAVPNPATGCADTQDYVRFNGHPADLNRDWPTIGYYDLDGGGSDPSDFGNNNGVTRGLATSEPEVAALVTYYLQFKGRVAFATDIHGMLNPSDGGDPVTGAFLGSGFGEPVQCTPPDFAIPELANQCYRKGHFVLSLLSSFEASPSVALRNDRLAKLTKERLDGLAAERYPYWYNLPNAGHAGGEFNDFGTVWDTLGYDDTGVTDNFFAEFLGAPGIGFELAYSHVTFDNKYLPVLNDMHVHVTREIVRAFLDASARPLFADVQTNGQKVAYLADPFAVEPKPNAAPAPSGAAGSATPMSDGSASLALAAMGPARPAAFFEDLSKVTDAPLTALTVSEIAAGALDRFDTLVIAGSAARLLSSQEGAMGKIASFAQAGGSVVLTDEALTLASRVAGADLPASEEKTYLGYSNLRREDPLGKDLSGIGRELYSAMVLGYELAAQPSAASQWGAPTWTFDSAAVESAKGSVAGTLDDGTPNVGTIPVGTGKVVFLGALLPPPTIDFDHPYGIGSYAVSQTGYQLLYNALGFTLAEAEQEREMVPGLGQPDTVPKPTPGFDAAALATAIAGVSMLVRRRR